MALGLGLNLGIGGFSAPVGGGGGVSAPTSTFTMTQLADTNRIYQRSTTTGGGQGKGQATIPVTISSATAGTINARCRDADGSTIVQPEWVAATITNGATTTNIAGVDARLGWFYLDLKDSSGAWKNGTTLIGVGALFAVAGQSLMSRFLGRAEASGSYSTTSITPSAYGKVCASYSDGNTYQPSPVNVANYPWQSPQDGTDGTVPNGVGCGAFLNDAISFLGVNCGVVGHAHGGVSIGTYMSGQSDWTQFAAVISRIGGAFEGFFWGQGHTEATQSCPPNAYKAMLDLLYAQVQGVNSYSGFKTYIWTIPGMADTTSISGWQAARLNKGAQAWCAANSATFVHFYDLDMQDSLHPKNTAAGSAKLGRYMARALRANYGLSSAAGPQILSATRSGTTITVTVSDVGQTSLNLVGSPGNRMFVFPSGKFNTKASAAANRFPVSSVTSPNKTTLTVTLANDPGDGNALDLWWYYGGIANPTADNIYDDVVTGSISTGRPLAANFTAVAIAPPGSGVNAPPSGNIAQASVLDMTASSQTYGTGATGFGQEMTGGTASSSVNFARMPAYTAECFYTCPTLGSTMVVMGNLPGGDYLGVNASGNLFNSYGLTGATTLIAGKRYHIASVIGPNGKSIYLTNITDAGSPTRDANTATAIGPAQWSGGGSAVMNIRNFNGSFVVSGGAVDDVRFRYGEKYTGSSYTTPTAPAANDDDTLAIYHLDGDTKDAVGW